MQSTICMNICFYCVHKQRRTKFISHQKNTPYNLWNKTHIAKILNPKPQNFQIRKHKDFDIRHIIQVPEIPLSLILFNFPVNKIKQIQGKKKHELVTLSEGSVQ